MGENSILTNTATVSKAKSNTQQHKHWLIKSSGADWNMCCENVPVIFQRFEDPPPSRICIAPRHAFGRFTMPLDIQQLLLQLCFRMILIKLERLSISKVKKKKSFKHILIFVSFLLYCSGIILFIICFLWASTEIFVASHYFTWLWIDYLYWPAK